jgi:hypothetical protein
VLPRTSRNYRLLWVAQSVSEVGDWFYGGFWLGAGARQFVDSLGLLHDAAAVLHGRPVWREGFAADYSLGMLAVSASSYLARIAIDLGTPARPFRRASG